MIPVWLLDVDGVINGGRCGWSSAPHRGFAYVTHGRNRGQEFKLRWSGPLMARIRSLHLRGVLEVRWCTTWCPERKQLEDLFRLPELASALDEWASEPSRATLTKQSAAQTVLEAGRPLIWTDDEAIPWAFHSEPGDPPDVVAAATSDALPSP